MLKSLFALCAVSALPLATAQHQAHSHHEEVGGADNAPIQITINPEVRVSVTLGGPLPMPVTCGQQLALPVRVINQGFLTAPLEVTLIEPAPEHVQLQFGTEPLKGISEEHRILHVTQLQPGPLDITIAFHARGDSSDLGGRDRIHLLLQCHLIK